MSVINLTDICFHNYLVLLKKEVKMAPNMGLEATTLRLRAS